MRNRWLAYLCVVVVPGIVLQLLLPHLSEETGLVVACLPISAAGGLAAVRFWQQFRVSRGRQCVGVFFGAGAATLLSVSYLLYSVDGLLGGSTRLEALADVAGILAALVSVPAILTAVPPFPTWQARCTYAIDVATVAGAIFATTWQLALAPAAERMNTAERDVYVATMLPEILAAALALMLVSRTDARQHAGMRTLAGGMGMFALAALISVHNNAQGLPWYADGLGAVYLVAGLTIAYATRYDLATDRLEADRGFAATWSVLPHLPVIIALAAVAWPFLRGGTLSPVLVGTLLCTSALAVLRQILNSLVVKGLIIDLEAQRHRLDHLAHHDTLTGLPNRAAFQSRGEALLVSPAPGTVTGVLMLDLDGFKSVNDTLGHAVGDALLAGVAERITRALRPGAVAARLGGDEFAIVAPGLTGTADAVAMGEWILRELAVPMNAAGARLRVRGSAGVSVTADPGCSLQRLLHEADQGLYEAKAAGKGVVRAYTPEKLISGDGFCGAESTPAVALTPRGART